jgi:galactose mutarotase-like enzyme
MRHLQFWSQPGKDFVCLEPFWGPNGTVNTERRLDLAPGAVRDLWMRIELLAR